MQIILFLIGYCKLYINKVLICKKVNPTNIYNAYDVITPVSNLAMFLLKDTSPFSNPYRPINSMKPLSIILVVCAPSLRMKSLIYLL